MRHDDGRIQRWPLGRAWFTAGFVLWISAAAMAQIPPDPNYVRQPVFGSYGDFKNELTRIVTLSDPAQRTIELDAFWQTLLQAGQVPYAQDDRVAFLYRSQSGTPSVSWPGDFNGWNPGLSDWAGTRLGDTDLYLLEKSFPSDARLDYKLSVDGSWQLDPANPLLMWGGFGPNNELRMPDYEFPFETVHRNHIPHGAMTTPLRVSSQSLGYDVQYRVYTPAGYQGMSDLPVAYVTDGHEYAVDYLGAMVDVMDNLIADGALRPMIAVFIDPRNPDNLSQNRRSAQYITNSMFADFVAEELVPLIDANYATHPTADERTILGTSLGGLNSAYFGAVETDTFHNIAIQSPAFWADPDIYTLYQNPDLASELKIFMTNGTIRDDGGAFRMRDLFTAWGYDFQFTTANESHSWGNWRGQLDDVLIHLVGPPVPEPSAPLAAGCLVAMAIFRRTSRRRSSERLVLATSPL